MSTHIHAEVQTHPGTQACPPAPAHTQSPQSPFPRPQASSRPRRGTTAWPQHPGPHTRLGCVGQAPAGSGAPMEGEAWGGRHTLAVRPPAQAGSKLAQKGQTVGGGEGATGGDIGATTASAVGVEGLHVQRPCGTRKSSASRARRWWGEGGASHGQEVGSGAGPGAPALPGPPVSAWTSPLSLRLSFPSCAVGACSPHPWRPPRTVLSSPFPGCFSPGLSERHNHSPQPGLS